MTKKIVFAADHAGFKLKQFLINQTKAKHNEFELIDLGTHDESSVDYPDIANLLVQKMLNNEIGVLICGTGIGVSIAANRYRHIRAALCHNQEYAALARQHNNANVLVLGARYINQQDASHILDTFLNNEFSGGRHTIRVAKL
jgi:ribose 5-phosphate isomerase B